MSALPLTLEPVTPRVPVATPARSRMAPRDAGEAYEELLDAVEFLAEAGRPTPCSGEDSADWTSDDPERQARAADRCHECPLMFACRSYADSAKEKAGTWGGKTRLSMEDIKARAEHRRELAERQRVERQAERARPRGARRRHRQPVLARDCQCRCGGRTRGGRYLPGHDSLHLKALFAGVTSGALTSDAALAEVEPNPSLQAKLRERLVVR